MAEPLRVAVTGFDGLDNPHPGGALARAIKAARGEAVSIAALVYDAYATGAWLPGTADQINLMPSLADGDDAVFDRLAAIHRATPIDALVPCLDLEVPAYGRLADRLRRIGIATLLPAPEAVFAVSKPRLAAFCHRHDIAAPATIHVGAIGDLALHADQFGYPLMVKGTIAGAERATDALAAVRAGQRLDGLWGGGVLLQRWMAGDEFVVSAVVDADGEPLAMVAMRKLSLSEAGKAAAGIVVEDPDLERLARRVIRAARWRGPLELEFLRPHDGGAPILLEMNCRFPSWIELAGWAGINLPDLLIDVMRGVTTGIARRARAGTLFVRDVVETAVPAHQVMRLDRLRSAPGFAAPAVHPRRGGNLRVAVSGLGACDAVAAGLGVARSLRNSPEVGTIIGLGHGEFDAGLFRADLFDAAFRLPGAATADALMERLVAIHRRQPFDVLLPCLDGELPHVIANRAALSRLGVATLLPDMPAFERRGKARLFLEPPVDRGDIAIPPTRSVETPAALDSALAEIGLPAVLKGPASLALPVHDAADARAALAELQAKGMRVALLQQMVVGDRFAVALVLDRTHRTVAASTIKKHRICGRGSTWSATSVDLPGLVADLGTLLASIGWVGPAEGEFIRDARSDRYHLIEINPRFTAWIGFAADLGANHPAIAAALAVGRPPPAMVAPSDRIFMRGCIDRKVPVTALAAVRTDAGLRHG